jgi:hypothetical protein
MKSLIKGYGREKWFGYTALGKEIKIGGFICDSVLKLSWLRMLLNLC